MPRITVQPQRLREAAQQFRSASQESSQIIGRVEQQLHALQSEWAGLTSMRFDQVYQQMRPRILEFPRLLAQIQSELEKAAERFETADSAGSGASGIAAGAVSIPAILPAIVLPWEPSRPDPMGQIEKLPETGDSTGEYQPDDELLNQARNEVGERGKNESEADYDNRVRLRAWELERDRYYEEWRQAFYNEGTCLEGVPVIDQAIELGKTISWIFPWSEWHTVMIEWEKTHPRPTKA